MVKVKQKKDKTVSGGCSIVRIHVFWIILQDLKPLECRASLRIEYRVWNPFRSKLGAGIVGGIGACPVKPGAKVLYLGGASGTTVSHVSDMVGPEGAKMC